MFEADPTVRLGPWKMRSRHFSILLDLIQMAQVGACNVEDHACIGTYNAESWRLARTLAKVPSLLVRTTPVESHMQLCVSDMSVSITVASHLKSVIGRSTIDVHIQRGVPRHDRLFPRHLRTTCMSPSWGLVSYDYLVSQSQRPLADRLEHSIPATCAVSLKPFFQLSHHAF